MVQGKMEEEMLNVIVSLKHEEDHEMLRRSWLGRDWPEKPTEADEAAFEDYEKSISTTFLREAENKDDTLLRGAVETALDELCPTITFGEFLRGIDEMSDREVVNAYSRVKDLPHKVVMELYTFFTGNLTKSFTMRGTVGQKLANASDEDIAKAAAMLREWKVKQVRFIRGTRGAFTLPPLPEPCTVLQAAEILLLNPPDSSVRCLRAMRDTVYRNPFTEKCYKNLRAPRREYLEKLREEVELLLADKYDAPLHDALRVLFYYSKLMRGDDGGLEKLITPPLPRTDALHKRLLSSFHQVDNLDLEDLKAVFHTMRKDSKPKFGVNRSNLAYSKPIKVILEECLYRCSAFTIPESVLEGMDVIAAAKPRSNKRHTVDDGLEHARKKTKFAPAETECLFNLSASIEVKLWDLVESPPTNRQPSEEQPPFLDASEPPSSPDASQQPSASEASDSKEQSSNASDASDSKEHSFSTSEASDSRQEQQKRKKSSEDERKKSSKDTDTDGSEDEEDNYLMSYTFDKLETGEETKEDEEVAEVVDEEERLEAMERDIAAVADEAAALAYVLIGRSMEEASRAQLEPAARNYLRSNVFGGDTEVTETPAENESEEDVLMRVLRSIPSLPPSLLENVSARFEELKEESATSS